ncbi:riboflavin synthase [Croceicoccus naphthovorans]|uniref:Riboflavin synthase n=1 Tax=Croceicoccus naphthovorans TaxID=1348774 RepID=A0A0G3XDU5_9SPHN|nr:riboflavin synthase [Croceicoccus naphthovorans]AKM08816.1 riboflavin synthase subunit alpha [Croceicoccus naphthovorans]MBB3991709.1 riboflavin synthase [Croceicoccus naphthovorans]
MFTGIVTAIGTVTSVSRTGDTRLVIACPFDPARIAIGASIACSGVCLTVVERGGSAGDAWFAVDVSDETISKTAPLQWQDGARLNLEPALKLGDELGGHIVTGHVDAVGRVAMREERGGSMHLEIDAPNAIAPYIAGKGSITVEGVSLTVNAVEDLPDGSARFSLNIIPHTAEVTTLGALKEGDGVNLEIDVLARYLKRMQDVRAF